MSVIAESTFVRLYADRLILQEEAKLAGTDSVMLHHQLDSLCESYGIEDSDVEQNLVHYQEDLATWKEFYDKVVQRLEELQRTEAPKPQPNEAFKPAP